MKKFLTILLVLIIISIPLAIWYAKSVWDKISFNPYFVSADFQGLTLKDIPAILASGEKKTVQATLGMQVKNDSNVSITFGSLKATLYYEGNIIGQTSDSLASKKFTSDAHSQDATPPITDVVNIVLSQATAKLLIDKITGVKPQIDYEISLSVLGIPITKIISIKNSFTW